MDPSRFTAALTTELRLRGVTHTWEEVNEFVRASWEEIRNDPSVGRWADEFYEGTRKPVAGSEAEEDDRPWEAPGGRRRDYDPHRGNLLSYLGMLASIGGLLTLFCFPCGVPTAFGGLIVWWLARQDLEGIEQGLVDPEAKGPTLSALRMARFGAGLAAVAMLIWAVITLVLTGAFGR